MNLGGTIQRLRTGQGMSQEELAAALEVSRQSVSKWETNASVPELDKLVKLSALFQISLDELVLGVKHETPPPEPPPAPAEKSPPPPRREASIRSTAQRAAGWILVCFAAAVWLALTAAVQSLLSVLFAAPFLACGVICLTVRRDAGLWCAWALLACVDWYMRYATGVSWSMLLLPQAYTAGMAAQQACAWGELLFKAALALITVMRFRKRPVEWTVQKRRLFMAGAVGMILLYRLPYWLMPLLIPYHWAPYRILATLLSWTRLALLTALLTALAQGVLRKPRA